eukprot:scaffold155685_cov47-Prasinocladus_malaysianus.AAC.1
MASIAAHLLASLVRLGDSNRERLLDVDGTDTEILRNEQSVRKPRVKSCLRYSLVTTHYPVTCQQLAPSIISPGPRCQVPLAWLASVFTPEP